MSDVTARKRFTIILIVSLFFTVFLAGYHHCCECYSHKYLTCPQADNQPIFLTAATVADDLQPHTIISFLVLPGEIFPNSTLSYTPLSGRAPPQFVT
jgi:hypothetical protein